MSYRLVAPSRLVAQLHNPKDLEEVK